MTKINTILIIKFGAIGDVLRTTPLLTALKQKYPQSKISWLTDKGSQEVLFGNSFIDEIFIYSKGPQKKLLEEKFDLAICLDKEKQAIETMMKIQASQKMGFGQGSQGECVALDKKSEYAVRLGIDDELKFRQNQKTYQEITFEQVGLKFQKEEYLFSVTEEERRYAQLLYEKLDISLDEKLRLLRPIVGLNTGSGRRFSGKKLPLSSYVEIVQRLTRERNCRVVLLGGPQEGERNLRIEKEAKV